MTTILVLLSTVAYAQNTPESNQLNKENLVATLRNDTLFVHKDTEEFANFDSATPNEIAFNKFRKAKYFHEKTIWFFYVVYDYGLFYVGKNKGGREIYESTLNGRIKLIPRSGF
ncbi:MAG: hypothetical protein ACQUHE_06605 [Bacteroidia bacterium]